MQAAGRCTPQLDFQAWGWRSTRELKLFARLPLSSVVVFVRQLWVWGLGLFVVLHAFLRKLHFAEMYKALDSIYESMYTGLCAG